MMIYNDKHAVYLACYSLTVIEPADFMASSRLNSACTDVCGESAQPPTDAEPMDLSDKATAAIDWSPTQRHIIHGGQLTPNVILSPSDRSQHHQLAAPVTPPHRSQYPVGFAPPISGPIHSEFPYGVETGTGYSTLSPTGNSRSSDGYDGGSSSECGNETGSCGAVSGTSPFIGSGSGRDFEVGEPATMVAGVAADGCVLPGGGCVAQVGGAGGGGGGRGVGSGGQNKVGTVWLRSVPIVSLMIDGKERLCLAQISNTLLKTFSYNEIHNRRVALGITCVQVK